MQGLYTWHTGTLSTRCCSAGTNNRNISHCQTHLMHMHLTSTTFQWKFSLNSTEFLCKSLHQYSPSCTLLFTPPSHLNTPFHAKHKCVLCFCSRDIYRQSLRCSKVQQCRCLILLKLLSERIWARCIPQQPAYAKKSRVLLNINRLCAQARIKMRSHDHPHSHCHCKLAACTGH